ncbi:uncharacterized protein LOC135847354 [Planococcus citri]|uniref:uncharacterized protein LOC135847354 n=1 Tax=Planococcus citri TaxID=170843 RepID=UPI0031F745C7
MENIPKLPVWNKWKRPTSIPYPNTWHRFTTKTKDGKVLKMKIVDLTPDRFEESLEFLRNYFYLDEPICRSLKLLEDEISANNEMCKQSEASQQRVSIIAVLDEENSKPEMVGLQKLRIISKDDGPQPKLTGNAMGKLEKIFRDLYHNRDPFEILETDVFLKGLGLCVKPDYQGIGIGYNLLLCLEKLANAYDVKGCMTTFTRIESQILAERVGFKMYNEISYSDYKDEEGRRIFSIEHTKSFKMMGIKY